jgi:hypothetical protein
MNIFSLSRDPLWSDDFAVLLGELGAANRWDVAGYLIRAQRTGIKQSNYSDREVQNEVERLYRLNLYVSLKLFFDPFDRR